MRAISFPEANTELVKPKDMTDEQCMSLPAFQGKTPEGFPVFVTQWIPNKEDLEALNKGEPLYLAVLSTTFPPLSLYTMNPDGAPNV